MFEERVPRLRPGVSEFFLHPVADGPELRGYDHEAAGLRADDAAWVVEPKMRTLVEEARVKLISFRPLRELQRAERVAARTGPCPPPLIWP